MLLPLSSPSLPPPHLTSLPQPLLSLPCPLFVPFPSLSLSTPVSSCIYPHNRLSQSSISRNLSVVNAKTLPPPLHPPAHPQHTLPPPQSLVESGNSTAIQCEHLVTPNLSCPPHHPTHIALNPHPTHLEPGRVCPGYG